MDLITKLAFTRWCEYTKRCGAHGLSWPVWRDAYNRGLIR